MAVPFDSKAGSTFVTPDNTTRVAINALFISTAANILPDGEYSVRVIAIFCGKLKGLNRSEVTMIMWLPDTKFGTMAPFLDLIIGMPIQVSQNVRVEKMVANGTLGTLETIVYHPETTFCLVHDSIAGMNVKVPSVAPPVLLVRLDRGASAAAMTGCGDANISSYFLTVKLIVRVILHYQDAWVEYFDPFQLKFSSFPLCVLWLRQ
ncbi:unnamed protein product [Phytophthora lilii]|uniref:Unnamed protein product n=1 Tax=Phytophthora lilii TaxID=2077276 RepID=A0A9W6WQH2_9STRA|nr:unnamed protein product [Phytophthora lilii]